MTDRTLDLSPYKIRVKAVYQNPTPARIYEWAVMDYLRGKKGAISSKGALIAYSGAKTGRSPLDKRIVMEERSEKNIWWGQINIPLSEDSFATNLDLAVNYLNTQERLYVIDGFAGWRPEHRIKIRIICARPYHALFMHNMLIRPSQEELASFGQPDWTLYNAGAYAASAHVEGVTSESSIDLNLKKREVVILGTEYAGCMKKAVFTILNYLLPGKDVLSMHCSANEGTSGDTAFFLGLSGTGKTTLSADPERRLIGDDEHGWDDTGIFNFEGGCYAKTVNLTQEREPEIWEAIRFGSVLENVVYNPETREVDYSDTSITENTRVAYPLEFMKGAKIPAVGAHPKNIIFLSCDAFGVLPPVSKLAPAQAMYHFMSGYSAKVAGTEQGVNTPKATFSPCFGSAFMVWNPLKYAELLKNKMQKHHVNVWLVNTGWIGGAPGIGKRMPLKQTRAMVDAILNGSLEKAQFKRDPVFGVDVPQSCPDVPSEVLIPSQAWSDQAAYTIEARKLAQLFKDNFKQFSDQPGAELVGASLKPMGAV
jgi:phosphoenolpyruvate carboxykinase (ATP)